MSIVVEDGTGLANSDAFVSVAYVDTYMTARGKASLEGADATKWPTHAGETVDPNLTAKEVAIVRATFALDSRKRWRGLKYSSTQALEWPRTDAYDRNGYSLLLVPAPVQKATAEAALVEYLSPGALTPEISTGGSKRRVKAGPVEVEYAEGSAKETDYTAIDALLMDAVQPGIGPIMRTA